MISALPVPYQEILLDAHVHVHVKRIDLAHPTISGNKFYKLKYNLLEAKQQGYNSLLSFGGAYSNHIYALAHAAQAYGFQSIGIIRGEELQYQTLNQTLQTATNLGMHLEFISRSQYRQKHTTEFLAQLKQHYPDAFIIPEGGTNALAVQGCEEILSQTDQQNFDYICCAVGTGGTISGIINASLDHQKILGFSALKGDFLEKEIQQWTDKRNWQLFSEDTFGGYGKFNDDLLKFIQQIQHHHQLPLEPIYTGKAFYRLMQLVQENYFPIQARILFIHTGGLQMLL